MNQNPNNFTLPKLNLQQDELRIIVVQCIAKYTDSFEFDALLYFIAQSIIVAKKGLQVQANVIYNPLLDGTDRSRVREIIWDFIIQRYLSIGNNHDDSWPYLSLTELGKAYFHTKKLSV